MSTESVTLMHLITLAPTVALVSLSVAAAAFYTLVIVRVVKLLT